MKTKLRRLLCCVTSLIMLVALLPAVPVSALNETNAVTYTFSGEPGNNEYYCTDETQDGASDALKDENSETLEYGATDGTEEVLKITGDEWLRTGWYANPTSPYKYYGKILNQIDFKYTQLSEGAVARFFGWSGTSAGSLEMGWNEDTPDSGIMLYNDRLYVRSNFTDVGYQNNFDRSQTYLGTLNIYSTPVVYDSLNANRWYTLTRLVDFSENKNQKQKVIVKDRATGEILGETGWIQAGIVDQDESYMTVVKNIVPIRTKWFNQAGNSGDCIMIDNFKLACISDPGEISYEVIKEEDPTRVDFVASTNESDKKSYNFDAADSLGKFEWSHKTANIDLQVTNRTYEGANHSNAYPIFMGHDSYNDLNSLNLALSDGTFKATGNTWISNVWARPFSGAEHVAVDVKFNLGTRADNEQSALLKLFGYAQSGSAGTEDQVEGSSGHTKFEESGLVIVNGALYTINPNVDVIADYKTTMYYVENDDTNYSKLLSGNLYTNQLLPKGTLKNGTWYTIERIVDMSNNVSADSSSRAFQMQKVKVTDKATGAVILDSDWTRVGWNDNTSRTLGSSLLAFTRGFKTGDTIEFDNYTQTKGSLPAAPEVDDYLNDGASDTNKPGAVRFSADGAIKTPTKENIVLKKGDAVVDDGYYTVTPDEDGDSFVLSFDYLEPNTAYTLTVTGLEDADYGLKYADKTYNFTTGDAAAFGPLEITNKSFVNEAGTAVLSFTAGQNVRAAVEIANDGGDTSNMLIIMAVYDSEGKEMKAALVCEQTQFETGTYYTPYYTPEGGETAKILIWDNWTNIKPIAPAFSLGEVFPE